LATTHERALVIALVEVSIVQPVDYTTLIAACAELRADWLPARLEQVYQRDRFTVALALRTLNQRGWLTLSWHPQAARIGIGDPPPRSPDTFTFSQQLRHQLQNLALTAIEPIAPWERVIDLQFARRPGEPAVWHLYVEIMGKYSNVILVNAEQTVITAAHQVSAQQSSIRPIQTGQPYETPPAPTQSIPTLDEPFEHWHERLSLIPGPLGRTFIKHYRGLSTALVHTLVQRSHLSSEQSTDGLEIADWQRLFTGWQEWLQALNKQRFQPEWTSQGYSVLGWGGIAAEDSVQTLLNRYYTDRLGYQDFQQLYHQLQQKLTVLLSKLQQKASLFQTRLQDSEQADLWREFADLLMAHLHEWKPGLTTITLQDFTTHQPITIPLEPEKNAVQNAQALYKRHQKLKRSRAAIMPLLEQVQTEILYLSQVETALAQLETYKQIADLWTLQEIRDELVQQGYLADPSYTPRNATGKSRAITDEQLDQSRPYLYRSPSDFEVLVGRNNRQNDALTFRVAGDYDLWFHTQEIPGSHVLLRLRPGSVPEESDIQFAADLAAYYSRGRQSDQVPVVYTESRYVFKPKGAKPGMSVYQKERVHWGSPRQAEQAIVAAGAFNGNKSPS
jgi:predicted ribosome quality control (RQC) complex YloA/Tae2 family protein